MSTPARLSFSLVTIVLIAAAIVGCGKKEEEPIALAMPSAAAVTPVKATQDPTPAAAAAGNAAAGNAAGNAAATPEAAATPAAVAPPAEAPKAAPPQPIDGCCSALQSMTRDAKLDAVTKSKASAALSMCNATAKLVKDGKASRSTALTQIKATMAGKAPSACNRSEYTFASAKVIVSTLLDRDERSPGSIEHHVAIVLCPNEYAADGDEPCGNSSCGHRHHEREIFSAM